MSAPSGFEPRGDPRRLEAFSLNAWPSLQTVVDDGWIVRFAEGFTKRANSVNPLYPGSEPLARKIDRCEARYARAGLATVFKISPAVDPPSLDAALAERGYAREAETQVLTHASLAAAPAAHAPAVIADRPTPTWVDRAAHMNGISPARREILGRLLGNILPPRAFAALERERQLLAVGLGVVEGGWLGLFDLVVDPAFRRQHLGRELVLNLLEWGRSLGAERAYLQVAVENEAARRLYTTLGFEESYRYWYRVRPAPVPARGA